MGGMKVDDTYRKNDKFWESDHETYKRRKSADFP